MPGFIKEEPFLSMGPDEMVQRHVFGISFMIRLPERSEWEGRCHFGRKGRLVGYTDGSKTNEVTGARLYD
jgi:hypothetical protein